MYLTPSKFEIYFGSSFSACCPTAKGGCAGVGGGQKQNKKKQKKK